MKLFLYVLDTSAALVCPVHLTIGNTVMVKEKDKNCRGGDE